MRSTITTHILDIVKGEPAEGISVSLYFQKTEKDWILLSQKKTNKDGRVEDFLDQNIKIERGVYRIDFETLKYFSSHDIDTFYPLISITFEIKESGKHFHVPLLLSPFGYSTYRGS